MHVEFQKCWRQCNKLHTKDTKWNVLLNENFCGTILRVFYVAHGGVKKPETRCCEPKARSTEIWQFVLRNWRNSIQPKNLFESFSQQVIKSFQRLQQKTSLSQRASHETRERERERPFMQVGWTSISLKHRKMDSFLVAEVWLRRHKEKNCGRRGVIKTA